MLLSLIVPTVLSPMPGGSGKLFLERCIAQARELSDLNLREFEIVVGVDPGRASQVPDSLGEVKVVEGSEPGISAALNAAIAASRGDVIMFLEDDDRCHRDRLRIQWAALEEGFDIVTSNSLRVLPDGRLHGIADFPNSNGWLVRRALLDARGPMDTSYQLHWDVEFIGRVGLESGMRRLHLMEKDGLAAIRHGCAMGDRAAMHRHGVLQRVRRNSEVRECDLPRPMLYRTVNPEGETSRIESDADYQRRSEAEFARLRDRWGFVPA